MRLRLRPCVSPVGRIRPPLLVAALGAAALARAGDAAGRGGRLPALVEDHPQVRAELRRFQGSGRGTIRRGLERGSAYLPMIRSRIAESGLPEELCWLPLIESGYANDAVSPRGAAGIWQLMPRTARAYGLRVDGLVDERRNPVKATRAALRHLQDLLARFDSPLLAAAAYNAGSGRVLRGLESLGRGAGGAARMGAGSPLAAAASAAAARADSARTPSAADPFFLLADAALLARETRAYVPRLIAASMIGRNPRQYGFSSYGRERMHRDSVVVTKATQLDAIAEIAGVPADAVRELNPELIRGVTPPATRTVVLLPRALPPEARERIAALPSADVSAWRFRREPDGEPAGANGDRGRRSYRRPAARAHVRVEAGESLEDVARRCGVSVSTLSRANRLPSSRPLTPGIVVRVP